MIIRFSIATTGDKHWIKESLRDPEESQRKLLEAEWELYLSMMSNERGAYFVFENEKTQK